MAIHPQSRTVAAGLTRHVEQADDLAPGLVPNRNRLGCGQQLRLAILLAEEPGCFGREAQYAVLPGADDEEIIQAKTMWTEYWTEFHEQQVVRAQAESMLDAAEAMRHRGRTTAALGRYLRLVKEYPGTEAAKTAQKRVDEMTAAYSAGRPTRIPANYVSQPGRER